GRALRDRPDRRLARLGPDRRRAPAGTDAGGELSSPAAARRHYLRASWAGEWRYCVDYRSGRRPALGAVRHGRSDSGGPCDRQLRVTGISLRPATSSDTMDRAMSNTTTSIPEMPEPEWEVARLFPGRGAWTEQEYLDLETNHLVELSNGWLDVPALPTEPHQLIVRFLFDTLWAFVRARGLGSVLF